MLVTLFTAMTNIPKKSRLKRCILAYSLKIYSIMVVVVEARVEDSWSHCVCILKNRKMDAGVQIILSLFLKSKIAADEIHF